MIAPHRKWDPQGKNKKLHSHGPWPVEPQGQGRPCAAHETEGGGGWLEWLEEEPGFDVSAGAGFFSFIITAISIMNLA